MHPCGLTNLSFNFFNYYTLSFFQLKSFIYYWLNAVDEHSLHSPYFFDLYHKVLNPKVDTNESIEFENLRAKLRSNNLVLEILDLGASSNYFNTHKRTISQVAATSLAPLRMCQLLSHLVIYSNAKQIIELGTSMGITTLYLAKQMDTHVSTFEGNPALVSIAQTNFEYFNKSNIDLIEGNIDKSLPDFLQTNRTIDFVLMDANHRYEPTLNYFHQLAPRMSDTGIIVVDDIYHSAEMAKAWHEIRMHELVYGSIDLFRCGILFFDSSLNKQHHTCAW